MSNHYTPMLEQYLQVKKSHEEELLFFRLGDFYEMFFEDAELAAKELEITLTSRDGGQGRRIPMCGVPYHSVEGYIAKLVERGYRVAICEQVEDPKAAKGIVKREVVRIITSGTFLQEGTLQDQNNRFLTVIALNEHSIGLAVSDVSTGECFWGHYEGVQAVAQLTDQLFRLLPAELVFLPFSETCQQQNDLIQEFCQQRLPDCRLQNWPVGLPIYKEREIDQRLAKQFQSNDWPTARLAKSSVAALLQYLDHTLKSDLSHLNRLQRYEPEKHMALDSSTLRNLEITRNLKDGSKKGTLFAILDFTRTAMGGRLLRRWLESPLLDIRMIEDRQDAIEELLKKVSARQALQEALNKIYDFERILTRIELGTANGRDLNSLKNSLTALPEIYQILSTLDSTWIQRQKEKCHLHDDVVKAIADAIVDEPPMSIREGQIIRTGYHQELDELRQIAYNSRQWLQDLEVREKEKTGIKTLKLGYNRVFGYYLEVTHANTSAVPDYYIRKQTLVNAERYIIPELKEFETKILGAQEKIVQLEYQLFCQLRQLIKQQISVIQETAQSVAATDTIISLAEAAYRYNYKRPQMTLQNQLEIIDGRHPVIERILQNERFVPNDVRLNHQNQEILLITGPNMAGKSTYMRQTALLVLLAQVGSYIPANKAQICAVDRIFTRIGASDDLATGQSTFMVEMSEVAHILKNATERSLVLLDEIGRGTSTYDGMSIAKAVIEYIAKHLHCFTLFATHYHELTVLENELSQVKNYSVAVKEKGKQVLFLRRIVAGGADKSYGIHVAQLAGLPSSVLKRAHEILAQIEQKESKEIQFDQLQEKAPETKVSDISLFNSPVTSQVIHDLLEMDVMTMTPLEALNQIYQLQNQARKETGQ